MVLVIQKSWKYLVERNKAPPSMPVNCIAPRGIEVDIVMVTIGLLKSNIKGC